MTNKVLVRNRNYEPYTETFMGEQLTIEPNGTIPMKRTRAIQFLRTISEFDPNTNKPKIKNLVIEKPADYVDEKITSYICPVCGNHYRTEDELNKHLTTHASSKKEVKDETPKAKLEPGMVACPFGCGFIAKNKTSLSIHLRTCKS